MWQTHIGKLYSSELTWNTETGSTWHTATMGGKGENNRILQMHANHRGEMEKVYSGDIAAAVGLKQTTTGDTGMRRNQLSNLWTLIQY